MDLSKTRAERATRTEEVAKDEAWVSEASSKQKATTRDIGERQSRRTNRILKPTIGFFMASRKKKTNAKRYRVRFALHHIEMVSSQRCIGGIVANVTRTYLIIFVRGTERDDFITSVS
jgi:hypothetical protein